MSLRKNGSRVKKSGEDREKVGAGVSERASRGGRMREKLKGDSRGRTVRVIGVIGIISVMLFDHAECPGNAERKTR